MLPHEKLLNNGFQLSVVKPSALCQITKDTEDLDNQLNFHDQKRVAKAKRGETCAAKSRIALVFFLTG